MSELEDEISRAYGILSHLNGVKNSPELRETLEKIQVQYYSVTVLQYQKENVVRKNREDDFRHAT